MDTMPQPELKDKDGKRWYDGIIYATGVDPGLKDVRNSVLDMVPEGSQVVDICCGTGELAFLLSHKCRSVSGVDHSSKMISYANIETKIRGIENVVFSQANAMDLSEFGENEFDYSILCLTLHEMQPSIRSMVLKEVKRISKQIIIIDYNVPAPMNKNGLIALFYEFVAGYDHLKHYLHYRDKGGMDYMLDEVGLRKGGVVTIQNGTLDIVTAE
jgi:ubiquinone/menaquinone biosynthesis C-methylase UbiE